MLEGPLSFSRRVGGAITRFKVTVVRSSKSLWSHVLFFSFVTGLSLGDLGHFEIHVFPPDKGWVTRRGIWVGQKQWEITEIFFCVNPPTTSLNLRCKIQNINNHQTVTQKTDSEKLKLKTNTNAFQRVVSTVWFVFRIFFVGFLCTTLCAPFLRWAEKTRLSWYP